MIQTTNETHSDGPILKDLKMEGPQDGRQTHHNKPGAGLQKFKPQVPQWVTNDRQVMRWFSYFIENQSTPAENVQRCSIFFYMVDQTVQINIIKDEDDEGLNSYSLRGRMVGRGGGERERRKRDRPREREKEVEKERKKERKREVLVASSQRPASSLISLPSSRSPCGHLLEKRYTA
jgi:hypothetical protein